MPAASARRRAAARHTLPAPARTRSVPISQTRPARPAPGNPPGNSTAGFVGSGRRRCGISHHRIGNPSDSNRWAMAEKSSHVAPTLHVNRPGIGKAISAARTRPASREPDRTNRRSPASRRSPAARLCSPSRRGATTRRPDRSHEVAEASRPSPAPCRDPSSSRRASCPRPTLRRSRSSSESKKFHSRNAAGRIVHLQASASGDRRRRRCRAERPAVGWLPRPAPRNSA